MKTKEQLAVEFVENFAKYGFRIDLTPTRIFTGGIEEQTVRADESHWWSEYVSSAETRLRKDAREILNVN